MVDAGARSGQACAVQAAAGGRGEWTGKGASEQAVGDDVDQVGVDPQQDPVTGQGHADAELGAAQGDASGGVDGAVDLDDGVRGRGPVGRALEGAGRPGREPCWCRRRVSWAGVRGTGRVLRQRVPSKACRVVLSTQMVSWGAARERPSHSC